MRVALGEGGERLDGAVERAGGGGVVDDRRDSVPSKSLRTAAVDGSARIGVEQRGRARSTAPTVPSAAVRRPSPLAVVARSSWPLAGVRRRRRRRARLPTRPRAPSSRYETEVESTTATDVPCQAPSRRTDRTTLADDATACSRSATTACGSRSRCPARASAPARSSCASTAPPSSPRSRRSRASRPTALGELGLSEVFPAAAGAPPDRPLAPGDRWVDRRRGPPRRRRRADPAAGRGPPRRARRRGRSRHGHGRDDHHAAGVDVGVVVERAPGRSTASR